MPHIQLFLCSLFLIPSLKNPISPTKISKIIEPGQVSVFTSNFVSFQEPDNLFSKNIYIFNLQAKFSGIYLLEKKKYVEIKNTYGHLSIFDIFIESCKKRMYILQEACVLSLKMIMENQFFHNVVNMSTQIRGAVEGLIFDKSLRLPEGGSGVLTKDTGSKSGEKPKKALGSGGVSRD